MDITVDVHRLPLKGETTISRTPSVSLAVGGKGANQAVAAARLINSSSSSSPSGRRVRFICQFGNDSYAAMLEQQLRQAGVDVSGCVQLADAPSGQGLVMLEPDGAASSIVVGGANTAWPEGVSMPHLMPGVGIVLLQREVPEHVNLAVAQAAHEAGVPVLMDAGGEVRALPDSLLPLITYLSPNELELQALTGQDTGTEEQVVEAASILTRRGVQHVLVTLAERGALLLAADGTVLHQPALPVPGGAVVDGTAAGDAFRAAFAVGLVEGWPLQQCLQYAAAAGGLAVSRRGALPSLPSAQEVVQLLHAHSDKVDPDLLSRLGSNPGDAGSPSEASDNTCRCSPTTSSCSSTSAPPVDHEPSRRFPLKIASRLNSMKARRDVVQQPETMTDDVVGWIARQAGIKGLGLVDLNYPEHFKGVTLAQIQEAVAAAGLSVGAINIRFPAKFILGAFTNPDPQLRQAAVQLATGGCKWAADLGARDLIVWSPYDGYDYHFQVNYAAAWQHAVASFKELVAACPPGVRVSLEFKPTDASTRFSIVPTTAAALLLAREVAQPSFGVTLDIGHLLMAGEDPAHSVAMALQEGKLFGLHLNDAHVKLGAEDGLPFGAVNTVMALAVVHELQKGGYDGHIYFDTFPTAVDPVREAEWNIRNFNRLWRKAAELSQELEAFAREHDAMSVLELLEAAEWPWPLDKEQ